MSSYTLFWATERTVELGGVQRLIREQHMWPGMTESEAKRHMTTLLNEGYLPFIARTTAIVNQPKPRQAA